jgi:hypothetical protein
MDAANMFDTPATYRVIRVEYGLLAATSGYLLWRKRKDVRWPIALGLFLYSDTLGYVPGAIAYRRSRDKRIAKGYYLAYNTMHSGVWGSIAAAAWARLVRPEWAMLSIPLHLGIDRAMFGNMMKPFSVPFEPEPHPLWEQVRDQLRQPWQGMSVAEAQTRSNGGAGGTSAPSGKSGVA